MYYVYPKSGRREFGTVQAEAYCMVGVAFCCIILPSAESEAGNCAGGLCYYRYAFCPAGWKTRALLI